MYDDEATQREKKISRNLAIGIHVLIIVLFIFGVSWHRRQSEPTAVADLWSSMTPPRQEPSKPEPRSEPPLKIAPKIEKEPPPPPPKPEVKAEPKPDIALKEKQEKERKLREQELERKKELEHKKELERKKEDEAKKLKAQQLAEVKKKDDEKRKAAEQQEQERRKEDELKRLAEQKDQAARAAAASASSRAIDAWRRLIEDKIRRNIVEPPNLQGNPQVEFDVVQIPGGEVLSVRMTKSSGQPSYDSAVERAINKASPLPPPPEPGLFVRELHLIIRPK
jgi:colicin import membrane protein